MTEKRNYAPKIHLMPPIGWLNDPNGLCQMQGIHHIFFQYSPDDPRGGDKYWGHYETKDYIHYDFTGIFLKPDSRADKDGVYSGSAYVENGVLYFYYTGNVKREGDYDYIYNGREGNTILVTSKDGRTASSKEWLLGDEDYPDNLSNHVRDPKVFCENGTYYMVLGARTKEDKGCVMIYTSQDKRTWKFDHFIQKDDFGFMWECPDLFRLEKEQYLSLSPQGLAVEEFRYQNVYQSGYFHATKDLTKSGDGLEEFTEWDYGFDFYAPQTYVDERGRRILIGWMGVPDAPYNHDPSIDEGWQHMLTLPRELHVDEKSKRILQNPICEIECLRNSLLLTGDSESFSKPVTLQGVFEILLSEFADNDFEMIFDEGFRVSYNKEEKVCCFQFLDEKLGYGRNERKLKLLPEEKIIDMRIFVDTCCMEIYMNHGAYVFTTKFFRTPGKDSSVLVRGIVHDIKVFSLDHFKIKQV